MIRATPGVWMQVKVPPACSFKVALSLYPDTGVEEAVTSRCPQCIPPSVPLAEEEKRQANDLLKVTPV